LVIRDWKRTRERGKYLRINYAQEILRLYKESNSCPQIADKYNTTQATINRIIKENSGEVRTISESRKGKGPNIKWTEERTEKRIATRKKNGWLNKNPTLSKRRFSEANKGKHPKTEWKKGHKMVRTLEHNLKIGKATLRRKEKFGYINSPETRRKIRGSRAKMKYPKFDTSIEIKIQKYLKKIGMEFYTHQYMKINLAYQCDVFIPSQFGISKPIVLECDGDYWHGNLNKFDYRKLPLKIKIQKIRDFERTAQLEEKGYRVIRLWECDIRKMTLKEFKKILYQNLNKEERTNNFMRLLKDLEVKIGE